jgi:hypothetical protein
MPAKDGNMGEPLVAGGADLRANEGTSVSYHVRVSRLTVGLGRKALLFSGCRLSSGQPERLAGGQHLVS